MRSGICDADHASHSLTDSDTLKKHGVLAELCPLANARPQLRTQCAFPEQNRGPADRNLFGDCQFGLNLGAAGLALADETLTAARLKAGSFPTRNGIVQARRALAARRACAHGRA